jgi:hypothetical protein
MVTTFQAPEKELPTRLAKIAANGPAAIDQRLHELECEWTTGRLVKASSGVLLIAGLALAAFVSPWWLILPAIAGVVLAQYLFFCRSVFTDLFAAAGFRSGAEIENERIALRILRGDFRHLPTVFEVEDREAVSRMEGEGGPAIDLDDDKLDPKEAANRILEHTGHLVGK